MVPGGCVDASIIDPIKDHPRPGKGVGSVLGQLSRECRVINRRGAHPSLQLDYIQGPRAEMPAIRHRTIIV